MNDQNRFSCGPSGGTGGTKFDDPPPPKAKIRQINIWVKKDDDNAIINGIQVEWSDGSSSKTHGSETRSPKHYVPLDDDEYLVGISGRYGDHLDYITFVTTKKECPFGGKGGDVEFYYNTSDDGVSLPDVHIIGFLGRSGDTVDAIGCIFTIDK